MSLKVLTVSAVLLAVSAFALVKLCEMIAEDYEMYEKESACVAKFIALEVARKDIVVGSGTCEVKRR